MEGSCEGNKIWYDGRRINEVWVGKYRFSCRQGALLAGVLCAGVLFAVRLVGNFQQNFMTNKKY